MTDSLQTNGPAGAPTRKSRAFGLPREDRVIRPTDAEALPDWAQAAFPAGLQQEGPGVWARASQRWNLDELARINEAGARRVGAGPETRRHFEHLLRHALEGIGSPLPTTPLVLDLRSGDGARSVLPWLDLLPGAQIIASDPASMSLATLIGGVTREGHGDRVLGLVADAEDIAAAPASFDMISGVACLQELPDPDRVIAMAASVLRPGGYAIFLAPFDGHGILRVAYDRICAEAAHWPEAPLTPGVEAALRTLSSDIAARTLPDPTEPSFRKLRDKWLFSRESLEAAARQCGFSDVRFLPHNDHETLDRDFALTQLRSVVGSPEVDLPPWAIEVLDSFDAALRPPVKRLLMLEGTVLLRR